ncbi:type IV toxin-antitoxin system AbiEi family antitoxin domain-containing protein [Bradyrhizobium sp. CCBAU 53415]|uniref:type IV toxin-antitoxin system AbiEi family antitoxin domain-containing protein n=1 Tax=Bradyrhizobium sp. CCBAU 53415 TaxID=1325119 RepID=UPI002305D909|nr:type IV toxin-antitoxin system AbiEi family antitoxin domain-containing protein [Bradyrhizobium sp. CCBAU 53415]
MADVYTITIRGAELPDHESFHQVDKLMEGMGRLGPKRLQKLLVDCNSVEVKRLFFFAGRHQHAQVPGERQDGSWQSKRMLAIGGKFDSAYQITVPEDLDGVL